jgi:hypothetical protein
MMAGMVLGSGSMGICARRKMYLAAACLLGGLLLAVFVGGLGGPARAAGGDCRGRGSRRGHQRGGVDGHHG